MAGAAADCRARAGDSLHASSAASEIEGAYAPLDRGAEHAVANGAWQYGFLRSRANSIEGGTTDILRNIIAERVLGLPRMR